MQDLLDEIINEATDAREVKRAVRVKRGQQGFSAAQICQVLKVSPHYVSKGKGQYEAEGAAALRLGSRGSESYLSEQHRAELTQWIASRARLTWHAARASAQHTHAAFYH